jgi:hypothetical protein
MLLAMIAVIVATASAAIIIVGLRDGSLAGATASRSVRNESPLDEA